MLKHSLLMPLNMYKSSCLCHKVSIQTAAGNARKFIVDSSNGKLKVTCNTCMCMYWTSMRLPCRHIFAVRDKCHVPLFDPILVTVRWTNAYMRDAFNLKNGPSDDGSSSSVEVNR